MHRKIEDRNKVVEKKSQDLNFKHHEILDNVYRMRNKDAFDREQSLNRIAQEMERVKRIEDQKRQLQEEVCLFMLRT